MITALFVPVVAADSHQENAETNRSYQIVQGDRVISVEPIQGNESVEEFYDYRHPHVGSRDDPHWGRQFSSVGTTRFQRDNMSILMLYEGPDGVSMVAVHDKYYEEQTQGSTGGSVSWTINGLPEDGEWAVIDDEYGWLTENETKDDIFLLDPDHQAGAPGNDGAPPNGADALLSWVWLTGRSDGVAYRGLDQDVSITIDPAWNSGSYHRYGDQRRTDPPSRPDRGERYNGSLYEWDVIVPNAEEEGYDRTEIDRWGGPVEIRSTSSPPAPRSVTLEETNIEPGETARVSAVIENNGADWTSDVSFRVGDTELDSQTVTMASGEEQTVEFSQEFTEPGVYDIGVGHTQKTLTVGNPNATTNSSNTDDSADTDNSTDEQLPGFGPLAALVALTAVTIVARYRTV